MTSRHRRRHPHRRLVRAGCEWGRPDGSDGRARARVQGLQERHPRVRRGPPRHFQHRRLRPAQCRTQHRRPDHGWRTRTEGPAGSDRLARPDEAARGDRRPREFARRRHGRGRGDPRSPRGRPRARLDAHPGSVTRSRSGSRRPGIRPIPGRGRSSSGRSFGPGSTSDQPTPTTSCRSSESGRCCSSMARPTTRTCPCERRRSWIEPPPGASQPSFTGATGRVTMRPRGCPSTCARPTSRAG